jgi:starch-binding outer membrane protein, SusD/RagB family
MNLHIRYLLLCLAIIASCSCKKFLDEKPDKSLVVPTSLQDLQAMLDNNNSMNTISGAVGEGSADNYYLAYSDWAALAKESARNNYVWEREIFFDDFPNMWAASYIPPHRANVILEALNSIPRTSDNAAAWDNVRGSALFFRARSFYTIAVVFAKQYKESTAATDPGIPLRLNSDFNETAVRSSLRDSYAQIILDLKEGVTLLPVKPLHVMRPSKPAAYAFLARTYMAMRQYTVAGMYADSCLQLFNTLIDYNTLTATAAFPLPMFNPEVIFQSSTLSPAHLNSNVAKIDSNLFRSYAVNDLRRTVFFRTIGTAAAFKGSYNGSSTLFDGIATDEIYLVKAECLARDSNTIAALNVLNALMIKRWKTGTFIPYIAASANDALTKILAERRKELLMRDLRWMDLKRLNKEPQFAITLKRLLNNQEYILPPNDNRYALPIPDYVIQLSGMLQNPR